jgi:GNAT superfamily N-acetyltransferase
VQSTLEIDNQGCCCEARGFTVHVAKRKVIRADSEECTELEVNGWRVVARSWGASLDAEAIDRGHLEGLIDSRGAEVEIRELTVTDSTAVLALDALTLRDYPGDIATAHQQLTTEQATCTAEHRGWGAFTPAGELVAVTFTFPRPTVTETDFTVVHPTRRGQGLGSAVKAASVLALAAEGHRHFRTGGSLENVASIAANHAVGYVLDEEWLTLTALPKNE